ncbi:MAG: efflux RND transporter permease subunit [Bacteroidaceae bacterium]|nr:efflux RND transporter permease subunit [Bacteroidaceae bacterium]
MKNNWVGWLMRSYRITFLLLILAFIFGIFGFDKMAKTEFPDFVIRQGVVVAVYPGATAEEIEEQVAKPLERYLFTFDEVKRKKTTTTSTNGMCITIVELQDNVDNKDEVWSKIKHGLNTFKAQSLPSGVFALSVNDDFGSSSALLIAIESDIRSHRELKTYSDDIADALRRIPSVSNVVTYGDKKEQITIYVDQQRLAAYGIGKTTMMQALQSAGMTTMSGSISGMNSDVPIHVAPSVNSEQQVEEQIIYSDKDKVVRVKDIADVRREYDMSDNFIEYNGHPCILLSLEMMEGNNIVQYGKDVQKVLDEFTDHKLPKDVTISRITDQAKVVDLNVTDFMINLIESMVIIIVMLLLFPWRTAVVAGITVPISTFISIGVMYMIGIPLNTVTLAGLIIVLGMIVDNAIVVLDGYLEYLNKGMSRWHAAAESAQHYFMPMMLATLCISAIFFPLMFVATGIMHDFIYWLPWTIFINLMVSLVLAVVAIPIMEVAMIKKRKTTSNVHVEVPKPTSRVSDVTEEDIHDNPEKKSFTDRLQDHYNKVLAWTFDNPKKTIVGAVMTIVLSIAILGPMLKIRMMPTADRDQFAVEITLPAGSGLKETKAITDSVYNFLKADDRVVSITTFVGCSSPRFHSAYAPKIGGRNFAQMIVNTKSNEATVDLIRQYEPLYSEHYPNAFVKFKQIDFQNYNPYEYRFYGENIDSLRKVADDLMVEMRKNPDLMNVRTDWDDMRPIYEVTLDPVATSRLGLTRTTTELQLALSTGATQVGHIWEGDYEVPLKVKDKTTDNYNVNDIQDTYISTVGSSVPLRQIAEVEPEWKATNILHRCGERCITVTCDLKSGVLSQPLHGKIEHIIKNKINIPEGVRFEMGGEPENDMETSETIGSGLAIAVIIIFFFILFNFKQYKLTFICLAAITLCIPGTLIGLAIMNRPIGVTAVFGLITLMGMIMRNEILIFEHANGLVRKGWSVRDAAFDAGKRRMVPIFLTTATTAVGVVPMIIAATNFWMPVGVTIFAGGIGSLIMVITVLPVIYWKLNEKK